MKEEAMPNNPDSQSSGESAATPSHDVESLLALAKRELKPLKKWAHRCHEASIALVNAGIGNRVARGWCSGVSGQHSWVVVGDSCYDRSATIIDPTLWSYRKDVKGIFIGLPAQYNHQPHGSGSIWEWGRPVRGRGKAIRLTPSFELSREARRFLAMLGSLDVTGWMALSSAPVEGWPSAEIFAAMDDTKALSSFVPIDKLGMLTERNPGGLYLPSKPKQKAA